MKLYFSPASPFVRKVMACAIELGLESRIERLPSAAHPINRDQTIIAENPLGQVPTLLTDEGMALYDSRVACEYLDSLGGNRLFPPAGPARWQALVQQALCDGMLGAALLARYELLVRPEDKQLPAWRAGQLDKVETGLARLEGWVPGFGDRVDIGTIAAGCTLGYLDFRFPGVGWQARHPGLVDWYEHFRQRPSLQRTVPVG